MATPFATTTDLDEGKGINSGTVAASTRAP